MIAYPVNKIILLNSFALKFTNLISKTNKIWENLKGDKTFPLQSRIYNSICVITIAVMIYSLILSLIIDLNESLIATVILIICQLYLYYLSRYKGKTLLSFVFYSIIFNLYFSIAFTLHSGIQGSALLSFSICYFISIIIVPKRQYWFWTVANISLVVGLIAWEYYRPESIQVGYGTRTDRFVDIGSTYIVTVILILACLSYIINNYNQERQIAENNAFRLAQLNKQKNDLISIISHDFNAPLNNINNYLYVLNNIALEETAKSKYQADLSRMTFDTQNLLLNLLSWAKSNMDGMKYQLEPVNVHDSMVDTLSIYQKIAAEKHINLNYNIPDDISIIANLEMVEIIFRNLISNAIKFTPVDGVIRIFLETENGFHKISISDTGLGISKEKQPFIFETELSTTFGTERERGVGLGLKICKEFTENLGGQIWFSSEVGVGTTFCVRFAVA